jgi:hypothetical protein
MYPQNASSQRTPPTRRLRRARDRADHAPPFAARRQRSAVAAPGRGGRELRHPVGGLEGYTPAEVHAEQMRERLTPGGEPQASGPDRVPPVTHYLRMHG